MILKASTNIIAHSKCRIFHALHELRKKRAITSKCVINNKLLILNQDNSFTLKKKAWRTHEESWEDFSDSTSSDNLSIYTETSSSEEDLQNVEEPGTSTSSATNHDSLKGKSKSSSKQPTVKRSKRQQSFFAGKAYLKIDSLVKTPLHEFMAVARSELWAPARAQSLCLACQHLGLTTNCVKN